MSINTPRLPGANEVFTDRPDEGPRAVGMNRRRFLAVLGGTLAGMATGCSALKYGDDEVGTDAGPRSSNSGWGEEEQCLDLEAMAGRPDVPIGRVIDEDGEIRPGFPTKPCKDDWMPDASVPETDGGMPDAMTPPDAAEVMPPVISDFVLDCERTQNFCGINGEIYDITFNVEGDSTGLKVIPVVHSGGGEAGFVLKKSIDKNGNNLWKYNTQGTLAGAEIEFRVVRGDEEEIIFTSDPIRMY